ncbi:MAG: ABC transporter permease [Candidatus Krumholzibacteriota bacterium]|nr:ABC transporter permease [Candidatus Krumholzibacteriota bacterium]
MMSTLVLKLALRGLGRNRRRTLLSVVGVGVGCAVALLSVSMMRGAVEMRVRAIAESGMGHARAVPADWPRTRESALRLADWRAELAALRAAPEVAVAAPRARSEGLLGFGTRVAGVELLGVEPEAEWALSRLARAVNRGRYLAAGDSSATVIGAGIAERLDVGLGDDLFLTVVGADGEMRYDMLRVVGIIETGSKDIDASICHLPLAELQRVTERAGAGEITLLLRDPRRLRRLVARLDGLLPAGDAVIGWDVIMPSMGGDMNSDRAFMASLVVIVILVVVLGVTSAQLTAVLERRREFAVLLALGMKGGRLAGLLLLEAAGLGLAGASAGLVLGTPLVHRLATTGFDLRAVMGEEFAMEGVLFDPVFYGDMGSWLLPYALLVALGSTLAAALYPAWSALRTDPASALSLREG